jgi:sensor domain CHASE-containing protein
VDLFAEASAQFDFSQAVDAVIAAYRRDGLQADAEVRSSTFARLSVSSGAERAKVELGVDWRKNKPILLAVGPVLHADDAVANKVCALFGRAEVRDYVDVAAILASGRYSEEDLVRLAEEHDPGFDPSWFTEALNAVDRLPDTLFAPYGLDPQDVSALKAQMHAWAEKISRD